MRAVIVARGSAAIGAGLAGTPDTGAVYVFDADAGTLRAALTDGEAEADLGWAIVAQRRRLIVGAAGEEGEVHLYERR